MFTKNELDWMNLPFITVYDDDDANPGESSNDSGESLNDSGESLNDSNSKESVFTQADVDRMIQSEKAKVKRSYEKRIKELQKFRDTAKLTQEEKEHLESQINEMQREIETKEQAAQRERETIAKKHQKELQTTKEEASYWKTQFEDSTIRRALTDAAIANNAFNPEQIVAILRPNTEMVEV
ncbi:MAG TPA: hypothetical protein ENK70_05745, partial [Methylophaga sp.]|nr:hypothetical protein [Methylophaga sp.]